jgi:hypothetical protein
MKIKNIALLFILAFSIGSLAAGGEVLVFRGASDASAAAAISENLFIVADDENNILRVYDVNKPGLPVFSFDLTKFLNIEPEHPEADIEGATKIGRRIYWITSHGRNKDGKMRPNRYRFFATDVKVENANVTIDPEGKPYSKLAQRLIEAADMRPLKLDKATRFGVALAKKQREKLAPKKDGLNIEALCASADGKTIYIGFRNPRPVDKSGRHEALVVPLNNPSGVIDSNEAPVFGEPILWDLKGAGIRSMEYSEFHKAYFIIAGAFDEAAMFTLYRWSGQKDEQPEFIQELSQSSFSPEAMVLFKDSGRILLLSDDGSLPVKVAGPHECMEDEYRKDGTCPNKYLLDSKRKTFRGIWLVLRRKSL